MAAIFNDDNFEQEVMNSEIPVVVDFFADWCGPCKMMAPVVDELAGEYEGKVKVCKVNVDESPNSAARFKVMSIPTIIFLKNGETVDTVVGAVPKNQLAAKIEELMK